MKIILYHNDKTKTEEKAVELESLVQRMNDFEMFTGTTEGKIYEAWYSLKQELFRALASETKEDQGEGDDDDGENDESERQEGTPKKTETVRTETASAAEGSSESNRRRTKPGIN